MSEVTHEEDETVLTTAEMLDEIMAEDDADDPYLAELQVKYLRGEQDRAC